MLFACNHPALGATSRASGSIAMWVAPRWGPQAEKAQEIMALMCRVAVDDRLVDDIFFDARHAMQVVDAWEAGSRELTFHPAERRWFGDSRKGYSRESQSGELKVTQSSCGSWKINRVPERCFINASTAQRYAEERLR